MTDLAATLQADGAVRLGQLVRARLEKWEAVTQAFFDHGKPGHRIASCPPLARLAQGIAEAPDFVCAAGTGWSCVRAIAFNKTPATNWGLAWHQDRTIAVKRRETVCGFETWSSKDGIAHVEPPFEVLERMVTVRVHLDPVDAENAPLLVALASHRRGKIAEEAIDEVINASPVEACHAEAGDIWIYATPIVHASARSRVERSRRVIHLDFSRDTLPKPLEWAGIG